MLLKHFNRKVTFEFKAEILQTVTTHSYFILHTFHSNLNPMKYTHILHQNLIKLLLLLILFEKYRSVRILFSQ
jgi:hypothetical protein